MQHFRVAHPIEIRAADVLAVTGYFDVDGGDADHRHHHAFRSWQPDAGAERARLHDDRSRFVPRDQLRFLLGVIVEKESKKKHLRVGAGMIEPKSKYGFLRQAGRFLSRHYRDRFHPFRARLRLRAGRGNLPEIEPGALDCIGFSRGAFRRRLTQRVTENFLTAGQRDREEEEEEKRGDPWNHLGREVTSTGPNLQALRHLEDRGENAVNHETDDDRDDHDDYRRDEGRDRFHGAIPLAFVYTA